jgi:adenosylcobinamide-GDP ribazoletransferase
MVPFFPVVGLIIGILLCMVDQVALLLWSPAVAAVIDALFLAAVTGALHLDGLSDTADGLFSHRSKDTMLNIMKDSRIGVMGAIALFFCLSVKVASISDLRVHRAIVLMVVPALARANLLWVMKHLPYGRDRGGTGADFFKSPLSIRHFWGALVPLALCLLMGWRGIAMLAAGFLLTMAIVWRYRRQVGCVTGDMLGAAVELNESVLLLTAVLGGLS